MDHPCSHMCLQGGAHKDHVKGYRCVCPTGYALKEGSTTQCADGEEGFYLQHLLIYISLLYRYIFLNCSQRGLTSLFALPSRSSVQPKGDGTKREIIMQKGY